MFNKRIQVLANQPQVFQILITLRKMLHHDLRMYTVHVRLILRMPNYRIYYLRVDFKPSHRPRFVHKERRTLPEHQTQQADNKSKSKASQQRKTGVSKSAPFASNSENGERRRRLYCFIVSFGRLRATQLTFTRCPIHGGEQSTAINAEPHYPASIDFHFPLNGAPSRLSKVLVERILRWKEGELKIARATLGCLRQRTLGFLNL